MKLIKKVVIALPLFVSITIISSLGGCGGGGGGNNTNPSPPTGGTPPPPSKFTSSNTGEIATIMMLMGEGLIDVSELIESEFLWFYHAPENISIRNCREGGSVVWNMETSSKITNTGTFTFNNCLIDKLHAYEFESQPPVFNGVVTVNFNVTQYPEVLDLSDQNIIQDLRLSMSSAELLITEFGTTESVPVKFNLTSNISQKWEDNTAENLRSVEKEKELNIDTFAAQFFENEFESLSEGTVSQYESDTPNAKGYQYQYQLAATYTSEQYDFVGNLIGDINLEFLPIDLIYSSRDIKGTFNLTSGDEEVNIVFDDQNIDVSSANFLGQALTYEVLDSTTFRLKDNYLMYSGIQSKTPFTFVSFQPENQLISPSDEKLTFTFNKKLVSTVVYIRAPFKWTLDWREVEISSNKFIVDINTISNLTEQFGVSDIDLMNIHFNANAYRIQPSQEYDGFISVVSEGKGQVLELENKIHNVDFLKSKNEIFGLSSDIERNGLLRFNAQGSLISESFAEESLKHICIEQTNDRIFVTKTTDDYGYTMRLLELNDSLDLQAENELDYKHNSGMSCQDDYMFFYDIDVRPNSTLPSEKYATSYFDFGINTLTELGFTDLGYKKWKVLNPFNKNQVFTLSNTMYYAGNGFYQTIFEIIVSDFISNPSVNTILDIEQQAMEYNNAQAFELDSYPLFINKTNNTLMFYNVIIDLSNNNQVVHEFTGQDVDGKDEFIRFLDSESNIVVTSHAVYQANNYAKLFDLPFIDRSIAPDKMFMDNQQRLNVLIDDNIIYQTPVLQ